MKFFTPELLKRCRSGERAVAEAASDEWDAAVEAYAAHLKGLRPLMPNCLRRAVRSMPALHDSRPLGIQSFPGRPRVALRLRLEGRAGAAGEELELVYSTVTPGAKEDVTASRHDIGSKGGVVKVLYHEFDLEGPGVFTHSLLLSDGWVLRFRMRDMLARLVESLEPLPFKAEGPHLALA